MTDPAAPSTPSGLPAWARDILRCPACHADLRDITGNGEGAAVTALECTAESCADLPVGSRRRYRLEDGIPVLLIDDADVVSS